MRTVSCLSLVLPSVLALAAPGAAQGIQISGETTSVVGVYAATSPTVYTSKELPKATKFTTSFQVKTVSGSNWAEAKAGIAGDKASFQVGGVASSSNVGGGQAAVFTDSKNFTGSPSVRFTFKSATPVSGRMVVLMTPRSDFVGWGNLVTSEASVKVGSHEPATASLFFGVAVTKEFAATVDSNGTTVDVTVATSAIATTQVTFGMDVEVAFVPGHRITAWGSNCADLHTGYPAKDTIDFHFQGALEGSPTMLIVGLKKVNVTIGWPGCQLLVDPLVILGGPKTDNNARATLRLPLPNDNIKVLAQGAIHEPWLNALQLSNGLEMEIVKR